MSQFRPYQPALLRILHGVAAVLVLLAIVSGFWVYNTYDKRWGSVALPTLNDIQGIHGTIAVTFLLLFPFFALYSFHLGDRRLVRSPSLAQLKQVGKPVWWISIHRLANTLMLLAATFALVTGRMMKEEWLPAGEIDRPWYLAHLMAWICTIASLALHLLFGAKVGGLGLLTSIFGRKMREDDTPRFWLRGFWKNDSDPILKIIKFLVFGGIFLAFILPVFYL
ncbi:cytochrome b/b6 domain-containing protein [Oscillatoriales cyanobacterium LEGE 11467]|uniref:Cytochrome b/b6 domain-containing protein n=1 Tax=Zarconia navalis LEGE 11467 TaxID=1828826 RepID=A0A928VXZ3_9CYAN|nr:cytochrome b/b6 domain-containing protein [Zarconia navalis]MBE9039830.1 cytochrome b/b6 domain-containing protein [Zarconia navalis LEGE 11467]